ncbi:MAG: AAA domain-containing protein, partial [Planctomycetaceae bacterium]|nr:AAA domain-containing protein [Planctomycetaceae bacterium]
TELNRHDRPQDLPALVASIENYRDQDVDFETDLASDQNFAGKDTSGKRQVVLKKLQERLFEINRRNRLLQFKTTLQTLNLTHASIPVAFDVASIRPDEVLTWSGRFQQETLKQKPVWLNRFLNFREAVYVPGQLDRLRSEARRDQTEYGFAQLKLIICFLRWADLKASPVERYESPLLLLPAALEVKKGIHDRYSLRIVDDQAEVNPVIRHLFRQLYDIDLPARVAADETSVTAFYESLRERIQQSDKSVELSRIDRPRIEMIHEKAKRRLDQFRRRARSSGRGVRQYLDLNYSYDRIAWQPLGYQLFENFVLPSQTRLEAVVTSEPPASRRLTAEPDAGSSAAPSEQTLEAEKSFYSLKNERDDNPYHWEFDLCSVTLANLRYRRMSLVNDYTQLVDDNTPNAAFESAFSITPIERDAAIDIVPPIDERYHVVSCDPTQTAAVHRARTGESYIIQGPPGTGKSQTITNLIADYVVRGRRILFVCEKRAAIDVVFHRLRQQGLADLCCLIHDSQADKKQFVMDLKQAYERLIEDSQADEPPPRDACLEDLQRALQPIHDYNAALTTPLADCDLTVRDLISRLIASDRGQIELSQAQKERLPAVGQVISAQHALTEFTARLQRISPDGLLSEHPLALLSPQVADAEQPAAFVSSLLDECLGSDPESGELAQLAEQIENLSAVRSAFLTWRRVREATEFAASLRFLAEADQLGLTQTTGEAQRHLQRHLTRLEKCDKAIAKAEQKNRHWHAKLPSEDTTIALDQARRFDGSLTRFLSPAFWRLRKLLNTSYDFSAHKVRPSWTQVLTQLDTEHERRADRYEAATEIKDELHIDLELDAFCEQLQDFREALQQTPSHFRQLLEELRQDEDGAKKAISLANLADTLTVLETRLDQLLQDYRHLSPEQVREHLQGIREASDGGRVPDFLYAMDALRDVDSSVTHALRTLPLTVAHLERAAAEHTLDYVFREHRTADDFTAVSRAQHVREVATAWTQLERVNAQQVRHTVRSRFLKHVRLCSTPAAQLTPEQKALKKAYSAGCRGLEHEFGKTMRYKSIREIATGETGRVLQDFKPIWLMSPLSVSDTLPLHADDFDVVIFDEASQITLEEAIPSLFRASQTIVVGDEMQLPPTSFFANRREEDDDELTFEEDGQVVQYDLNSNSFLNHSSRNLPTRTLGWHYRSRSESLISFSNHAFYRGRLLTVPEECLVTTARGDLVAASAEDADRFASEVIQRPVSFHFCEHGVYEKRRNRPEAAYIAGLVRGILTEDSQLTVGIVAFSEAQQEEILRALRSLADSDPDFADLLEAAWDREVDGQFAGLLVKNLENIQGDERDVIIMSVCYGPDPDGRTRMNFGPINTAGGEKRLNVAFSRAKHHMALVSSMRSAAITNDYNDGANCLKNYLRYAEESSRGNAEGASAVLQSLSGRATGQQQDQEPSDPLVTAVGQALQSQGYQVDYNIGQSQFRCDLAVYREGDTAYRLGILCDTPAWYQQKDLLERELMRPSLLNAFGWEVDVVLAKDWWEDSDAVLQPIIHRLGGENGD